MGSKPINNKPNDATPLASNTAQSVMIDKPVDVDMNQSIFSTSKLFFEKGKSSNPSTVSIGKPITLKNNGNRKWTREEKVQRQKDNGCYVDPEVKSEIANALRVEMAQFRQESYDETHDSYYFPERYDEGSGYCGEYSEEDVYY